MKNTNDHLEVFSNIQEAKISDVVYEKILNKIENQKTTGFSVNQIWTYGIAASVVFILSIFTVLHNDTNENSTKQLAENMNIIPHNSLYN
ncbi:hypothetical protein NZ698_02910 [Chryseobacterium sp. PBS4-4]|uniref:Uncharacterized protein n=1 Tax=Chryseobacterium edaphi TaxID=2976532 RepID=A0ABT2W1M0_9FLAO|nr:hypothetical protein [Chryseobacterium edaphi]MCU7616138.1 hypothetical protein [Chryseobacterium edaphi]